MAERRHVHICGAPRSGTTLVMELMRVSYRWDFALAEETAILETPARRTGRWLTKAPGRGSHIRAILRDPGVWLIYCQRDPRDIICSRHGLAPDRYWANLRQWRVVRSGIVRAGPHPRLVTVRYEDLVRDPDTIQDMIEARIPWLERTGEFSAFHRLARPGQQSLDAMRGVRPVDPGSVGNWRWHPSRVVGQILLHGSITRELIEDGYEADGNWVAELSGVLPDLSPGFWPDRLSRRERFRRQWVRVRDLARLTARCLGDRLRPGN